jgi:HEAT repeat protein
MNVCYGVIVKPRVVWFIILFIDVLSLALFAQSQEEAVTPALTTISEAGPEEAAARQLRIYRETLLQGSTENVRVDAAVGLLLMDDPQSREILVSALKNEDNPLARQAICKALIKSRGLSQTMSSHEIFLEPLLGILQDKSPEQAELAAEAMLLFDYSEIDDALKQLLDNKELSAQTRSNAIYALQVRPEPQALRSLIGLLDSPDTEIVKAAETALQEAFGIPVGTSRTVWADILSELQRKKPEDIRRERLLRQEMKLREVQAERDRWQKLYVASLDKQYEPLDETGRAKMMLEMMDSDLPPLRLWALDKLTKYPITGNEKLREKLLAFLSDPSRDVRLRSAKVLMNLSVLNPAAKLLERFGLEKDPEVALAMFEALGEAVFFAFSSNSQIELPPEIKTKTLAIASEYLNQDAPEAAEKGANVIGKILELNNLPDESIQTYLGLLDERYLRAVSQNGALRANLLAILARLCGQGGAKEIASNLYAPLFIEGLTVPDNPALRLAAAQGLVYVDKVKAMELFRQNQLMLDESVAVRQIVIDLAGQTGQAADLDWLLKLLSGNGYSEPVWQAIRNICQRQSADFLLNWVETLELAEGLQDSYVRDILDMAEQKAAAEKNSNLLMQIQQRTIARLVQQKTWDQATAYLVKINYSVTENKFSEETNNQILKICLYGDLSEKLVQYIQNKLAHSDLNRTAPYALILEDYFSDASIADTRKRNAWKQISSIQIKNRPQWSSFLNEIDQLLEPLVEESVVSESDAEIPVTEEAAEAE